MRVCVCFADEVAPFLFVCIVLFLFLLSVGTGGHSAVDRGPNPNTSTTTYYYHDDDDYCFEGSRPGPVCTTR